MPRLARKDLETSFYHVIVQGINREYIFKKKEYVEKYLYLIHKYRVEHNIKVIAYCIMNNHAHLLIYAGKVEELTKFMRRLNTTYAKTYNQEEKRVGYVFRDRYKSEGIYKIEYLFNCISYIHKNPVEAKMVIREKDYKYSSYNDYINKKGIVNKEMLELVFGSDKNYLETFYSFTETTYEFLDEIKEGIEPKEIIDSFCIDNKITMESLADNNELLVRLIKELKIKSMISARKIAKLLNLDRNKVIKIANKL